MKRKSVIERKLKIQLGLQQQDRIHQFWAIIGKTATLTYDVLDHLVACNAGSTNQQWYAYDASGNRVLLRSTTGSGTSITTYAFGLEEHLYGATGINTGNTYYYYLGGRIIGILTGITTLTTQFFLTDALGSVLATFSATAGSAAVLGNQVYGPNGNQRYTQGSMGTAKGYTGQYADATGLDYYNARYYDPIVGLFVSADTVQGNEQGMDPYAYVGGNPETMTDPTGQRYIAPDGSTAWINPNGAIYGQSPGGNAKIIGHTPSPTPTHRSSSVSAGHGNPKSVKSTRSQSSHSSKTGNKCDLNCRAGKAAAALHEQDAKATARNSVTTDIFTLVMDGLSIVADLSNTFALAVDIAGSVVPHLLHFIADVVTLNGGTVSPLLQSFMAVGDALAGVANVIKSFAFLAFAASGVISRLASFAEQRLGQVIQSAATSIFSAAGSFASMSQDVINLQDYNIDHVWSPQRIIDQCQYDHLSSCG